jgi:hypothetical protein
LLKGAKTHGIERKDLDMEGEIELVSYFFHIHTFI